MSDKNTMSMIDKVLIEMKNGNIDNFEILYELTSKPLLALCYSYTKNVEDSEDALHDTYMKALQQIKKFKGKKGFNWLYTIAKNTSINILKKKQKIILIDVLDEENSLYFVDTSHSLIEDNQEILKLAKEILKDNEFRLIILHTIEGLSLVEIAKSLNKNESTIRWQYNNGLNKLRKELERRNKYWKIKILKICF